jgi:predicted MFS family arabinose efflux permease
MSASDRIPLWTLLFGNLVIGTGVLLPSGMLNALMEDLNVSAASAGLLLTVGGIVVGIGAPILAALTSRIDRRTLLAIAATLYVVGHAASALATDLTVLLVFRALTVAGAAIFTPQAAATAGLLVPAEQRGAAIGFIFIGWSLAAVIGIPLGSLLSASLGSAMTFGLMAVLSALMLALLLRFIPRGLMVQPLQLSSWLAVLRNPALLLVLVVTLFSLSGQFVLFTFIAPVLRDSYGLTSSMIALIFFAAGLAGVGGTALASRHVARLGADRSVFLALCVVALGFALVAIGWGHWIAFLIGASLWSAGGFAANSIQQGRLVGIAPALASATVALNSSFVYFGQSIGSSVGGGLIADGAGPDMAMAAVIFTLAAIMASVLAARAARPA